MPIMATNPFEMELHKASQLSSHLLRHIVPLYLRRKGKPQLVGTGFLVSSGTSYYLVSAAHVFDERSADQELFFYIEPETKRKISGNLALTKIPPGKNRSSDPFDIGVLKLGEPFPPYPKVEKYPLPISAFMANALPREGKQYLLIGFPASKSHANPVAF